MSYPQRSRPQQKVMIIFEGLDGTGKTTMLNKAYEFLLGNVFIEDSTYTRTSQWELKIYTGKEPSGTLTRSDLSDSEKTTEYIEMRDKHIEKIEQDSPDIVLMDRWVMSNLVYQGIDSYKGGGWGKPAALPASYDKLTIVFSADLETCAKRKPEDYQEGSDNILKFKNRMNYYRYFAKNFAMIHTTTRAMARRIFAKQAVLVSRPTPGKVVLVETSGRDIEDLAFEVCTHIAGFLRPRKVRLKISPKKYFASKSTPT